MDTYVLKAVVERVYDGDTPILMVDRGWNDFKRSRVRMARINAPEMNSTIPEVKEKAVKATEYLAKLLPPGTNVYIKSHIFDNYGRVLGEIYLDKAGTQCVSDMMLASGLVSRSSLARQIENIKNGKLI